LRRGRERTEEGRKGERGWRKGKVERGDREEKKTRKGRGEGKGPKGDMSYRHHVLLLRKGGGATALS